MEHNQQSEVAKKKPFDLAKREALAATARRWQDGQEHPPMIRVRKLTKNYYLGRNIVPALRGVDLEVERGEFVALMGPSGSGKSTFMNLLGCLDRPTGGSYILDGVSVSHMSTNQLADVRNHKIGFVFQGFNLLPWMTALDNVQLPLTYTNMPAEERSRHAWWALSMVGLRSRAHHRPMELSGGQQQRVAIARALVTGPSLLLADEPTGNLDSQTSMQVMTILQELNTRGLTIVLVTHESDIANYCPRQVRFRDGRVMTDTVNATVVLAQNTLISTLPESEALAASAPTAWREAQPLPLRPGDGEAVAADERRFRSEYGAVRSSGVDSRNKSSERQDEHEQLQRSTPQEHEEREATS